MRVTVQDIRRAVARELGLPGSALCVHASLRSFGRLEGGAQAVVDGLLAEGCTVLVPTFSWSFAVPPPPDMRPARNGWDYTRVGPQSDIGRVYTPETNELDAQDMGAAAAAVLSREKRIRGNHPLCSFTAVGPLAVDLIAGQRPLNAYAPFEALVEAGGSIILMGVGLETMSLLHLAERQAGRNLFRRWANGADGRPMEVEVGGCSEGFGNLETILSPLGRTTGVGCSLWRVFPSKATLDVAAPVIRENPTITHCGRACIRCDDAVQGGPRLFPSED